MRLLELLLVVTIFGVITLVVLKSNHWFNQSRQTALMQHDVTQIKSALGQYFLLIGCKPNGDFAGSLQPSLATLGLNNLTNGRQPNITHYQVSLVKIGHNQQNKPLYEFHVTAALNDTLTIAQQKLLASQLGAILNNHTLNWLIPLGQIDLTHTWLLSGNAIKQRRQLNTLTKGIQTYCAQ